MHEFEVKTMTCGGCAARVTQAIKALDAQATVEVDLRTKKVSVKSGEGRATLADALSAAGYPTT